MTRKEANEAAKRVLENLNDRRGYRQLWDSLDAEIKREIKKSLADSIIGPGGVS